MIMKNYYRTILKSLVFEKQIVFFSTLLKLIAFACAGKTNSVSLNSAVVGSAVPLNWKQQDIRPEMYECNSTLYRTGCHMHIITLTHTHTSLLRWGNSWLNQLCAESECFGLFFTVQMGKRGKKEEEMVWAVREKKSQYSLPKTHYVSQYPNTMCFPYLNKVLLFSFFFIQKKERKLTIVLYM